MADADGSETTYEYSDRDLLATESSPISGTTSRVVYHYEGESESLGDWAVPDAMTGYLYTARCHLDQVIYPDGTVTEFDYDCNGNLEGTWDANHPSAGNAPATAAYGYDPLNRLDTVTRPWDGEGGGSSITRYGYDVQDHLTSVIDAG